MFDSLPVTVSVPTSPASSLGMSPAWRAKHSTGKREALMRLTVLIATLLLTACAQRYSKPGASEVQFDADKSACERAARITFPPAFREVQLSEGHFEAPTTRCTGSGVTRNCVTTPGYYEPPATMSVDDNLEFRNSETDACLRDKGWTPTP